MTSKTASVKQYGQFVALSDHIRMTALDPVVNETIEMLADQAAITMDTLVREELTGSADATNVLYAAGNQRAAIAATNILTTTLLRKAVRALKKAKAPMFNDGGSSYYVALSAPIRPLTSRLMTMAQGRPSNQDKEDPHGEIARFRVKIIETTESRFSRRSLPFSMPVRTLGNQDPDQHAADAYVAATPSIQVTLPQRNSVIWHRRPSRTSTS
jgi:hypothetical protein